MRDDHKAVFVYTTWPSRQLAAAAGRALVEQRLAACVNIWDGMTSIYRWEGQVESDSETVMIVKTLAERTAAVESEIRARHPAKTPAIAVVAVTGGGADFLSWIAENAT